MNPTSARDLCNRLAAHQPEQALAIAREIEAPWFRCQALSQVARYWPDGKYDRILEEAVRAADLQDDAYKQVAVSAWPIRAYLERGNSPPARKLLLKCTSASARIENMGSRSEALFLIFQAAKPFPAGLWQPVFRALVDASEPALAWRQRRNLRDALAMVALQNPELVQDTGRRLSDPKNLSMVGQHPDERRHLEPRAFFWP